ncbi:MAG: hypothetical protein XD95_0635 [Microgenomates bacterium 39_7]|nr:MAG: hypothetical protein XD95_0635 [Microgenomates bacterium 39_7]
MPQAQPPNKKTVFSADSEQNNSSARNKSASPSLSYYTSLLKKQSSQPSRTQQQKTQTPNEPNLKTQVDPSEEELNQKSQNYPQSQLEESQIAPWMYKPLPEEDILKWTAPSRPFKKRNKKYFSTVFIIALLISLILGFAGQLAAITVVIAVAFLAYTLSVVPPQNINYKITTWGVRIENNLYYWEELGRFWFTKKYEDTLLNIECARFPNRVTMLIGDQKEDVIKMILSEVLLNQKPEPTLYEKAASWLQKKIPLDIEE